METVRCPYACIAEDQINHLIMIIIQDANDGERGGLLHDIHMAMKEIICCVSYIPQSLGMQLLALIS